MAIDGVLLHRIVTLMDESSPIKINRITQPSNHEFLIHGFFRQKNEFNDFNTSGI
ncbi:hypothetical protein MGH68_09020 [Erysipelothrix sp. D19-032]